MSGLAPVERSKRGCCFSNEERDDSKLSKQARAEEVAELACEAMHVGDAKEQSPYEKYDDFIIDVKRYQDSGDFQGALEPLNRAVNIAVGLMDPNRTERLIGISRMYRTLGDQVTAHKVLDENDVFRTVMYIEDVEYKHDQLMQLVLLYKDLSYHGTAAQILEFANSINPWLNQQPMDD